MLLGCLVKEVALAFTQGASGWYMQERNRPYAIPTWKVLWRVGPLESIRTLFNRKHCCGVGGIEAKIAKVLTKEVGGAGETECLDGLVGAFADARMNLYLVDYF